MQVASIIAVYLVVWWVCLFVVLPWGTRSQHEAGEIVPGTDPGAPALFRIWPKLLATTLLAAVATALLLWLMSNSTLVEYLR